MAELKRDDLQNIRHITASKSKTGEFSHVHHIKSSFEHISYKQNRGIFPWLVGIAVEILVFLRAESHANINRQNRNFEGKSSKEREIPMFILCKMKNSTPLFK